MLWDHAHEEAQMTLAELAAMQLPPTITVEQAAEIIGIGRSSAYRAAQNGDIPVLRIGRRLFVPSAKLLELLGLGSVDGTDDAPAGGGKDDTATPAAHSGTCRCGHPRDFAACRGLAELVGVPGLADVDGDTTAGPMVLLAPVVVERRGHPDGSGASPPMVWP